jgi:hypothetical protein
MICAATPAEASQPQLCGVTLRFCHRSSTLSFEGPGAFPFLFFSAVDRLLLNSYTF